MKKKLFNVKALMLLCVLLFVFLCQYLLCIPVNIQSGMFFFELSVIVLFVVSCLSIFTKVKDLNKIQYSHLKTVSIVILLILIAALIGTPYTGGLGNYKNQSVINETDFSNVPQFDVTQVQLVDKNTAIQLGDRVFGTLGSDEVSQYAVGEDWNQISYKGSLYRVTPIEFGGLFKYFITKTTPGYIMVDCENGEAKLVKTDGLKYTKGAYFNRKISRYVFLHDPFALLGDAKFELDDNQKP